MIFLGNGCEEWMWVSVYYLDVMYIRCEGYLDVIYLDVIDVLKRYGCGGERWM